MEYRDSDAIFVSCTALRIVEVLQEAEDDINKIIISSNQSIIWDSLRSVKINDKISNYGKLFWNGISLFSQELTNHEEGKWYFTWYAPLFPLFFQEFGNSHEVSP